MAQVVFQRVFGAVGSFFGRADFLAKEGGRRGAPDSSQGKGGKKGKHF